MNERNKPTPKQIASRAGLIVTAVTTGMLSGCGKNKVTYPRSGTYNGPEITGRSNWDTFAYKTCDVNPGDQITITGRQATLFDNTKVVEIIEANGRVCLAMGTVKTVDGRTE